MFISNAISYLQSYLHKNESKISLTIDLWTSSNNKAFVSTTAHFIDNDWVLKEVLIDFGVLSGRHDGANIADGVYSVLREYEITYKVCTCYIDALNIMHMELICLVTDSRYNG
jgi:hypothetical protein